MTMYMNMRWRHALKLLVVVMGVVFIGTGCAGGVNDETVQVEATSVEMTAMSEAVTTESIGEIGEIVAELDGLSESILNQTDAAAIQNLLDQFIAESQRDIFYLYYGEADNDFWMSPVTALPEDYVFSERPVYQNAIAQGVYLPEAYSDALSGRAIHTVAKAILVDGEVVGVIGIDVLGD